MDTTYEVITATFLLIVMMFCIGCLMLGGQMMMG